MDSVTSRDPATSAPRFAPSIADGFRVLHTSQTIGLLGRKTKTPPNGGVCFWYARQSGCGVASDVPAHIRCRRRRNPMQWIPGEPARDPVRVLSSKMTTGQNEPFQDWYARQSGCGVASCVPVHTRCRRRRNPVHRIPGEPVRNPVRVLSSISTTEKRIGAIKLGTPDRTRTCYPRLRRPVLYPDELRARRSLAGQLQAAQQEYARVWQSRTRVIKNWSE